MPEYPIQIAKVQAPPLRDQTLARDRLLDWVGVKVHGRVVLVVAEAGYGKTTLLADFSRRTRIRTLWFRLDAGDRDWVGFLAYLVAAVRIHVPGFAPITDSLIRETSAAPPSRASVIDTFLRELGELPPDPIALILDDYHLVDDAIDIRHVVKELLARAPERLSFVFLSRRTPPLPLARLRALGEVATLGVDDLRFDEAETERLFRETYEMKLEPALVTELSRRTEGWAASLQLVRAALRGRSTSEVRTFIHALSGAEGDLYDYLAEEVVAELPDELQSFLMRTSLLETIDTELGPVAGGIGVDATRRLIDEGERLGLFGRRGPNTRYQVRAHPLVRDFLQARLARSIGTEGMRAIHLAVARRAEAIDWRIGTHHYRAAGCDDDARRVLTESIETILGTGAYAAAEEVAASLEGPSWIRDVLTSRTSLQCGDSLTARTRALDAVASSGGSAVALWNAMMVLASCGDLEAFESIASRFHALGEQSLRRVTAEAISAGLLASVSGDLVAAADRVRDVVEATRESVHQHVYGVSLTNLAQIERVRGDAPAALASARDAIAALAATSAGIELASARLAEAWALAHLGDLEAARAVVRIALDASMRPLEATFEAADIEVLYGDEERAARLLASIAERLSDDDDLHQQALLTSISLAMRKGEYSEASRLVDEVAFGKLTTGPAIEARRHVAVAHLALVRRAANASVLAADARAFADRQHADLWAGYARALHGIALGEDFEGQDPVFLSMIAEVVVDRVSELPRELISKAWAELRLRPERWRSALRRALESKDRATTKFAGEALDEIGEQEDVAVLRKVSRGLQLGSAGYGRNLARRLARRVFVEDLGHVEINIGPRTVPGTEIRRKVLALLAFLLTRPRFAAAREEVVEALWPDLDPTAALNSLNQTVYFLRRVFEPRFSDDTSPGYVGQTSEKVWLDDELIDSRSRRCRDLLRARDRTASPDDALAIAREYRARFALDFIYEDWAASYRDSLHAAFLRVIETSLRLDTETGHYSRGTLLAELALESDPDADDLQAWLVRLYRLSGAHAAAAEQYAHYAQSLRELGLDAPPLEEV